MSASASGLPVFKEKGGFFISSLLNGFNSENSENEFALEISKKLMEAPPHWEQGEKDIKVYTLGIFRVSYQENVWSPPRRSSKTWDLFKYIVSRRGKKVHQDELIEILWPDEECEDPQHALRTMVYRLRTSLNKRIPREKNRLVTTTQGCYLLNTGECWLDVIEFEFLCLSAQSKKEEDPAEAVSLYQKALQLYQGDYLPECQEDWVIPLRHYYRSMYVKSVLTLVEILRHLQDYEEIARVCQNAVQIVPFEENLHLHLMEALIKEGRMDEAREHYYFIDAQFHQKLGEKPSRRLQELYQQTQIKEPEICKDLHSISRRLSEHDDVEGAFFCHPDSFCSFYQLERRRLERAHLPGVLCLAYIKVPEDCPDKKYLIDYSAEKVKEVLLNNLRTGDVICRWDETQFLILLQGVDQDGAKKVVGRIKENYRLIKREEGLQLYCKIMPVTPHKSKK